MGFSENLQNLRKINQLSQEQLAEQLEVSRQAVSKWESGNGYPEIDKIIMICDLFSCNMDELLRGDIHFVENDERAAFEIYDKMQNKFSKCISLGVSIILLGVTILLYCGDLDEMNPINESYGVIGVVLLLTCVLIAVAIFIASGIQENQLKEKYPVITNFYKRETIDAFEKNYMMAMVTGVSLILFGVISLVFLYGMRVVRDNSTLPVVILMFLVTIAVGIFIYFGIQKDKYDIDKYNKINSKDFKKNEKIVDKICGILMLVATIIFLISGLVFQMWKINWIVYPIGGILCGIVSIIYSDD